jgi:hypothetical protein
MPRDDRQPKSGSPGGAGRGMPEMPRRRRWWRWPLALLLVLFVLDEIFTFVDFGPPYCGHDLDQQIEGETREAYRANLMDTLDFWGERYWEFEDGTLLRYDFGFFDDFGEAFQQVRWQTVSRISRDTRIDRVDYPAPPYLDEVRRELAAKHGLDHDYLRGHFVARSCEMMAAVVLTPESYARYRARHGLPQLEGLPAVSAPNTE